MIAESGRSVHVSNDPSQDAIVQIGLDLGRECQVLCFDEFQVTDVAGAWFPLCRRPSWGGDLMPIINQTANMV